MSKRMRYAMTGFQYLSMRRLLAIDQKLQGLALGLEHSVYTTCFHEITDARIHIKRAVDHLNTIGMKDKNAEQINGKS